MWKSINRPTAKELLRALNGTLTGSVDLIDGADVDTKTLLIDIGAGDVTVTFEPAKSRLWTIDEIVAKINTTGTLSGVAGVLTYPASDPTVGPKKVLTISHANAAKVDKTGTANTVLGFATADDTQQTIIALAEVAAIDHELGGNGTLSWIAIYYN